jgi:acyl dehydratase
MKFFEDIEIGAISGGDRHVFTADEIKAFALQYDPQPFHTSEEGAARSHFGRLCASGFHTAVICMRMLVESKKREVEEQQARGEPIAKTGPSPGVRDIVWHKPVYAGDTITFWTEVIEKRNMNSRPEWGLLFSRYSGTNQNGELVYSIVGSVMVERRGAAADSVRGTSR